MSEIGLLKGIGDLPDLLRDKPFKRVVLVKTNNLHLWACGIEYGESSVESFGVNPEAAIENALNMLKLYMEDSMPEMSTYEKLEKYSPEAYKLAKERWESL